MLNFISKFFMPQKVISFFTAVRNFLKGKKTYLAATIILLQALLSYIDQTLAITTISGFWQWAQGLASNEATLHVAEALAVFGFRAAIAVKPALDK